MERAVGRMIFDRSRLGSFLGKIYQAPKDGWRGAEGAGLYWFGPGAPPG